MEQSKSRASVREKLDPLQPVQPVQPVPAEVALIPGQIRTISTNDRVTQADDGECKVNDPLVLWPNHSGE